MTNNHFSREELINIIETDHAQCGEASALASMALAAMDSEPVAWLLSGGGAKNVVCFDGGNAYADPLREVILLYRHAQPAKGLELAGWQFKSVNGDWLGLIDEHGKNQAVREGCEVREVFAMADGVNDRDQVRREHAEWSQTTFGNVGPIGPLKHLSKEALEAAAEPGDLSEWADMQFLLWDAQRRAGITDEQITLAMIEKLAVNKQREWPAPKDGEPRLHIKELPAPVVPDRSIFEQWWESQNGAPLDGWDSLRTTDGYCDDGIDGQLEAWSAAMLAAAPHDTPALNSLQSIDSVADRWIPVSERMPEDDGFVYIWPRPDFGVELHVGQYCECSPKGDGWYAQVYEQNYGIEWYPITVTHWMPLPAAPQEVKSES